MALASAGLGSICSSATHSLGDWTIYFPSRSQCRHLKMGTTVLPSIQGLCEDERWGSPCPACSRHLLNTGCCDQGPWSESGLIREITDFSAPTALGLEGVITLVFEMGTVKSAG